MSQYLLKYNARQRFSTNYYKLLLLLAITTNI